MKLTLISFLSFFAITVSLGGDVVGDETLDSSIENERTIHDTVHQQWPIFRALTLR